MPSPEDIQQQRELLVTHRRNLAHYRKQEAIHGVANTRPEISHGIREARAEIARIKGALRGWGVEVEDLPDDTEPSHDTPLSSPPSSLPTIPCPLSPAPFFNPFGRTGRIDTPAEFFDREPLLERVFGELRKGCSLSLIGERQVGKSSLLAMVAAQGPQRLGLPADAFLSIDMQIIHDENDFYEALCDALDIETCRGFRLSRRLRGKRYILCLDEIEKMRKDRFSGDEREELRGLSDGENAPFTLVVASSVALDHLFPDAQGNTSPLANICPPVTVPRFAPDVARAFLAARLAGTGVRFSESQMDRLIEESGGHPAQLQRVAAELFRLLTE